MAELILLTETFPFDGAAEGTFLLPELRYLVSSFDRVRIVPCQIKGTLYELPDEVSLDLSLGESTNHFPRSGHSAGFCKAALGVARSLNCSVPEVRWFLRGLMRAYRIYAWLCRSLGDGSISSHNTLFYSYWCLDAASALACLACTQRDVKFVSRAHRIDLYPECRGLQQFPFHRLVLTHAAAVFPVSEHGANKLRATFDRAAGKVIAARLGVGYSTQVAARSEVRIVVSCSAAIPLKRLDLISNLVRDIALCCANYRFEWHHFGDGPEREAVGRTAATFPPNLRGIFHGQKPNPLIRRFYSENWIDLFINLSDSEGAPVSMMEAAAAGIPLVGRAVGGVPELLEEGNGFLLDAAGDWSPILDQIVTVLARGDDAITLRARSLKLWENKYNADTNFSKFARDLRDLI